jgi:putative transposase
MVNRDPGNSFPRRQNFRLRGYDYSWQGAYFVTICSNDKLYIFGRITNNTVKLNSFGEAVESAWKKIPVHFPEVNNEVFIVMPNHIHGIISINGPGRADSKSAPTQGHSLSDIVRAFKVYSTQKINRLRNTQGVTAWQRGYNEHVIRGEEDYYEIGKYIMYNPAKWETDPENQQPK